MEAKLFSHKPELHLPALVRFLSAIVSDATMAVVLVITLVSIVSLLDVIRCVDQPNDRIKEERALSLPMALSQKLCKVGSCPNLRP